MRKSIVTVLAAPLFGMLASIATPAAAEESVRVPYGDLDLTSAAGQATLNARIAAAVDKVCSPARPQERDGVGRMPDPDPRRRDGEACGDRAAGERSARRLGRALSGVAVK